MQVISAVSSLPKSIRVDPIRALFRLPYCNNPILLSSLNVNSIPFLLITRERLIYTYAPTLNAMNILTDDLHQICYGKAAIEEEIRNNANISRNNHSA